MKFSSHIVLLVILLVFSTAAPALAYDAAGTMARIDDYAMDAGLDPADVALYKTYAIHDPQKLPDFLRADRDVSVAKELPQWRQDPKREIKEGDSISNAI